MARAKRTQRAEARRRYRATLATDPLAEDAVGIDEASGAGSSQGAKRSNAAPAAKAGLERHAGAGRLRRCLQALDPAGPRPTGHRRAALDHAPHQGDLAAGPDHHRRHDRDRRDRRAGHGDRLAVHLLRRLPGDRRGVHRRLPRTAGQLGRRDRGRSRVGGLLRRAGRERAAALAVRRAVHGQCDTVPASRRSSTRRSWAPSSPPRRPGIAASSPCRARTGTVASRRPRSSAQATAGRGRHVAEGRAKR